MRKSKSQLSQSLSKSPIPSTSKYQNGSGNQNGSLENSGSIACLGYAKAKKKRLLLTATCLICKGTIEKVSLSNSQTSVFCSKACIRQQVQIASKVKLFLKNFFLF